MVRLPFIFVSPAKADDALFFDRQPDYRQYSQHLGDIRKSLTPDLSITNAFKLQTIPIGQNKSRIGKVESMLFKVYLSFSFVPNHNYCIYENAW